MLFKPSYSKNKMSSLDPAAETQNKSTIGRARTNPMGELQLCGCRSIQRKDTTDKQSTDPDTTRTANSAPKCPRQCPQQRRNIYRNTKITVNTYLHISKQHCVSVCVCVLQSRDTRDITGDGNKISLALCKTYWTLKASTALSRKAPISGKNPSNQLCDQTIKFNSKTESLDLIHLDPRKDTIQFLLDEEADA